MDYRKLVNKKHKLKEDYVPEDMVLVPSITEHLDETHEIYLNQKVFQAFIKMAQDSPLAMFIDSGYRSFQYQQQLVDDYFKKDGEKCYSYVALPGESEHQTGLAVDFGFMDPETGLPSENAVDSFEEAFNWVMNHAHLYGFILRYPEGKEEITGYQYEPWHLRYVGVDLATELYQTKETLEEYKERA